MDCTINRPTGQYFLSSHFCTGFSPPAPIPQAAPVRSRGTCILSKPRYTVHCESHWKEETQIWIQPRDSRICPTGRFGIKSQDSSAHRGGGKDRLHHCQGGARAGCGGSRGKPPAPLSKRSRANTAGLEAAVSHGSAASFGRGGTRPRSMGNARPGTSTLTVRRRVRRSRRS